MHCLSSRIEIDGVPEFWSLVARSGHAVLLLDYDGTLAPFHPDRMQAHPLDGVREALERIAAGPDVTVALVSGRPVAEVLVLTGLTGITIAGTHGFELYRPAEGLARTELPPGAEDTLDQARREAIRLVGPERAERKIATVALHVRGLDESAAHDAMAAFREFVRPLTGGDLEARDFDGGVELRVRHRHKGIAITEILAALPPAGLVVYIGDDETDEDAFRALPEGGVGIKVGGPDRPTHARGRLKSCEDVLSLLTDWIATKSCQ